MSASAVSLLIFQLVVIVAFGCLFSRIRAVERKLELFRSIYEYERRHGPIPDEDEI